MNNWYDTLERPKYSKKEYRFAEKILPKILSSNLLGFVRNPYPQRVMFNYVVPTLILIKEEMKIVTLMVTNYDDTLFYTQIFQADQGERLIEYDLVTPFGDLIGYEVVGNSVKNGKMVIERYKPKFFDVTLPKYLLKYYGITPSQRIYYLIEELLKNEIKHTINNTVQVRATQNLREEYHQNIPIREAHYYGGEEGSRWGVDERGDFNRMYMRDM